MNNTKFYDVLIFKMLITSLTFSSIALQAETTVETRIFNNANESQVNEIKSAQIKVGFRPNSFTLSNEDYENIMNGIRQIKIHNFEEIFVAVWSDRPYPVGKDAKLSDLDTELASDRAQRITELFKSQNIRNIKVINMAEKPGLISKWFSTTPSNIKKYKEGESISDASDETKDIAKSINNAGGPGFAVIYARKNLRAAM